MVSFWYFSCLWCRSIASSSREKYGFYRLMSELILELVTRQLSHYAPRYSILRESRLKLVLHLCPRENSKSCKYKQRKIIFQEPLVIKLESISTFLKFMLQWWLCVKYFGKTLTQIKHENEGIFSYEGIIQGRVFPRTFLYV